MEFPNDVVLKILSKLDIDTRRSLGVYTKLKIPQKLRNRISICLNKVKNTSLGHRHVYYVQLGPSKGLHGIHTMYKLCRLTTIYNKWNYSVCHAYTNKDNNRLHFTHFTTYENESEEDETQSYNISLYYYSTM